ncbi:porin family protein [Reichenbachiella sp.]|uniref:porin family protein n=1 Tax=Reichenbachiella sp. TaxID=2184521 RepID=UPI003B5CAF43
MKAIYRVLLFSFLVFTPSLVQAQVLITLLFGDALNTDKIEFGLVGGLNRSYINTISTSEGMNNFNLGFYFHVNLKNNTFLSTGVNVKSNVGATGMPTYSLGDADFDSLFLDGTFTRKLPVFYVPILLHQRFNNRWYIEGGLQLGLIHKAEHIFETSQLNGTITYTTSAQDEYKHIDAGLMGGVGYKFKKRLKSTAAGINYYYGLVDVSNNSNVEVRNSSLYFYLKIPIGLGKANDKTEDSN